MLHLLRIATKWCIFVQRLKLITMKKTITILLFLACSVYTITAWLAVALNEKMYYFYDNYPVLFFGSYIFIAVTTGLLMDCLKLKNDRQR